MDNIELEFISLKEKIDFPGQKDYLSYYNTFKQKFDREVHPEVKTKILEIEKEGYYNDHGVDHIKMVIDRATMIINNFNGTLIKKDSGFYISPYEIFILLMAIQLHDTGHLIGKRREHAERGKHILAKFDSGNILSAGERRIIGDIAKAHGGKNDPIGTMLVKEDTISSKKIRPQLLASILRLADELAEDHSRASTFLLNIDAIEKTSIIYHLYSSALDSVSVSGSEIKLIFYISTEILLEQYTVKNDDVISTKFLLDEIYDRTFKTFTESLYCSRFLPDLCRINCVKVNINILDQHDDVMKNISYELKEVGYPYTTDSSIFSHCTNLIEEGINLDGAFMKDFIEKKLNL